MPPIVISQGMDYMWYRRLRGHRWRRSTDSRWAETARIPRLGLGRVAVIEAGGQIGLRRDVGELENLTGGSRPNGFITSRGPCS